MFKIQGRFENIRLKTNIEAKSNFKSYTYAQGGPKKSFWNNLEEKCLRNSKKKWWSLSLYIFTSSQDVRAF